MIADKLTVLIVDDSAQLRDRLNAILHELSCVAPVLNAGTYQEACSLLESPGVHLVVLDIGLPDRSGIELLKLINKQYSATKVIMVSNYANYDYRRVCLSAGAIRFFDKSHEFDQLAGAIEQLCKEMRTTNS